MKTYKFQRILSLVIALLLVLTARSENVQELRTLDEFRSIHQYGKFQLIIEQSDTQEVILVGEQSVLDEIETSISNKTLNIKPRVANLEDAYKNVTIYIKTPVLEQVKQAGSGSITCDRLETEDVTFKLLGSGNVDFKELYAEKVFTEVAGSGDLYLNLKSERLKANIYGSGNLFLEGYSQESDFTIAGSGKIESKELTLDYCSASIYGSGKLYLNVRGKLDVEIFGGGSIYYTGKPEINFTSNGSGRIYKIAEK